jgi:hypothetical protein
VMTLATSAVSMGCTMHFGARMEVVDHRWLLAWVYADDLGLRTRRGRLEVSLEHWMYVSSDTPLIGCVPHLHISQRHRGLCPKQS